MLLLYSFTVDAQGGDKDVVSGIRDCTRCNKRMGYTESSYNWECDLCRSHAPSTRRHWHCPPCQSDICDNCYNSEMKKKNGKQPAKNPKVSTLLIVTFVHNAFHYSPCATPRW
jgi:hypothetical protein